MLNLFLHGVPAVSPLLHMNTAVDGQVGLGAPPVTVPGDGTQAGVHHQPGQEHQISVTGPIQQIQKSNSICDLLLKDT